MNNVSKDRAGFIPHILYILFSIIMIGIGMAYRWPSWVIATVVAGVIISMGLFIILGRSNQLSKVVFAIVVWCNVLLFTWYDSTPYLMLGVVATVVVLLALYDIQLINYMSVAATILLLMLNLISGNKIMLEDEADIVMCIMQFSCLFILEFIEIRMLKNRIKQDKELENAIEQLKQAQRGKDDFLANISHEIRTPLNAICGIGSVLANADVSREVKDQIHDINISSRNLMTLVSDIIDFSELENSTMSIEEEPYNITSVINDVVNMTEAWNKDKNLEIIVDCAADIPETLMGDGRKIYRIILNIMNNAIKFTNKGGVILKVEARPELYGVNLMFTIKDTGIGMKEEHVARLDSVYNQVDTKRDRQEGGIGLGVAISRKMISLMHGFFHVESQYGVGTTVSFVIPQKVVSHKAVCQVEKKLEKNIIFYLALEKYQSGVIRDAYLTSIETMVNTLKVPVVRCNSQRELQLRVERGSFNYLFVSSFEYFKAKKYYDDISSNMTVIVVANTDEDIELFNRNVRVIYKPFHVFAVVSVLNGEAVLKENNDGRWNNYEFICPDAKLLVVDDSPMNLKVATLTLRKYQIECDTAKSGKEALEMIKANKYDFIFMDHMMPEMDGVECLHQIRAIPGQYTSTVPIVALTANAIAGAREMLLAEGFDDFVSKPIEKSSLERVLHKFLGRYVVPKPQADIEVSKEVSKEESKEVIKEESKDKVSVVTAKTEKAIEVIPEIIVNKSMEKAVDSLELFKVNGIDTSMGLEYFDHSFDDYIEIVVAYYEAGQERYDSLCRAVANKDYAAYKIETHTLKSTSLTIGAQALSEKAKGLEKAAVDRDEAYIECYHDVMLSELRSLLEELDAKLLEMKLIKHSSLAFTDDHKSETKNIEVVVDAQTIKNWKKTVKKALDTFEPEKVVEVVEQLVGEGFNKRVADKIKSDVEFYNFLAAEESLKSLEGGDMNE